MEAGPRQAASEAAEALVTTPRGDTVRVPFFKSQPLGDSFWVVPVVVFWQVVLQEPTLSKGQWTVESRVYTSRSATSWEVAQLQRQHFLATSTTSELMIPLEDLVDCLGELCLRLTTLDATLQSLEAIQANSTVTMLAHNTDVGGFSQLTECTLPKGKLAEEFSLFST